MKFDLIPPELRKLAVPITEVQPHPENYNVGDVDAIKQSLLELKMYRPIVVQKSTGYIMAGNHTYAALVALGATEVARTLYDCDDDTARRIMVADNQLARLAQPNVERLSIILQTLRDKQLLAGTGFTQDNVSAILQRVRAAAAARASKPDAVPPPPKVAVTQPGDMWVLGAHRLYCGDATDGTAYTRLMAGDEADVAFTDPPYNVGYDPEARASYFSEARRGSGRLGTIKNDEMTAEGYLAFLLAAFGNMNRVLRPGGASYVCHADTEGIPVRTAYQATWKLSSCLIWVKSVLVFGRSDYHWMHEPILYGWREGAAHTWLGDRKQTTLWEVKTDHYTGGKYDHPTQKPVELIVKALGNSSPDFGIVLDPFGGSGSTLIAAEMTGRQARLLELDPIYCDVIAARFQKFTGILPVREGQEVSFGD